MQQQENPTNPLEGLHGGLSEHAVTEDHRKEMDKDDPMVKIRKVAVMGPNNKQKESADTQKFAK